MKSHLLLKRTQGKLKARNPAKARLALLITLLCLTTPSMGQKIYPRSSPSLDSLCSLSFIPSSALLVPRHSIPQCQQSCVSLQPRLLMFYQISYWSAAGSDDGNKCWPGGELTNLPHLPSGVWQNCEWSKAELDNNVQSTFRLTEARMQRGITQTDSSLICSAL